MIQITFLSRSIFGLCIAFSCAACVFADQKMEEVAQALREADAQIQAITINATVEQPVNIFHPDFGTVKWKGTYSRSQIQVGLSLTDATYSALPAYKPPHAESGFQPGTIVMLPGNVHDLQGNLVIWRPRAKHILTLPDQVSLYDEDFSIRINPKNEIESIGQGGVTLSTYRADQRVFDIESFLFATGRGFSRFLTHITSMETIEKNKVRLIASGFYNGTGTWILDIDPQEEYLVRKAVFTDSNGRNVIVCQTGGTVRSEKGLAIAAQGTVKLSISTDSEAYGVVSIHTVRLAEDSQFLTGLRRIFAQPPGRMHTRLDYRNNPSQPLVETGHSKR